MTFTLRVRFTLKDDDSGDSLTVPVVLPERSIVDMSDFRRNYDEALDLMRRSVFSKVYALIRPRKDGDLDVFLKKSEFEEQEAEEESS